MFRYNREEYQCIPAHTLEEINNYAVYKFPPGGFVKGVLSNDLEAAVFRADGHNRSKLPEIMSYILNEVPFAAWGSAEKVNFWLMTAPEKILIEMYENR